MPPLEPASVKRAGLRRRAPRRLWVARRRRIILWAVACLAVAAGWFGNSAQAHLSADREVPASAESVRAEEILERDFGAAVPQMVLVARTAQTVDAAGAVASAQRLTALLRGDGSVEEVVSYWSGGSAVLRSRNGHGALFLVRLRGSDDQQARAAERLLPQVTGRQGELEVSANGAAVLRGQLSGQVGRDRTRAELMVLPVTALLLLFIFRSAVASLLPMLVGALAITGSAAVLRLLTWFTPVSVYAGSITYALGFALAVDYSLFLLSRYREETARGLDADEALRTALATAGRAVAFSATTVVVSLSALLLFPLPTLRSIAYGGIAVAVLDAGVSLLVLPALLSCLGRHADRWDVFGRWRRSSLRPASGRGRDGCRGVWGRVAEQVMRRPVVVTVCVTSCLLVMAAPFFQVKFGMFDDRLFPASTQIGKSGQALREDFTDAGIVSPTTLVLPGFDAAASPAVLHRYAESVARLPQVRTVRTSTGVYEGGIRRESPDAASASFAGAAGVWLSVTTRCEPFGVEARQLAEALRRLPTPGPVLVGGPGAVLADIHRPLAGRLWWALSLVALAMLALVSALTRRPVLAVKALVLNVLSLSATFGALVFVFQEGHLANLLGGFTPTGTTDVQLPVLVFCVAFGLSMDYEVFLLARICEEHRLVPDTRWAVSRGLDGTAALFTWAAVLFAVVMAALATSGLVILKIIGVGLALAVVLDATLVRGLLVPAVMELAGEANWWTPRMRRSRRRDGPVRDVPRPLPPLRSRPRP